MRPPSARARRPRAGTPAGARGSSGEVALARLEPPARQPRERSAGQDLDMRGRRVVVAVLLAVAREPRTHLVLRPDAPPPLAVDEEVVRPHASRPRPRTPLPRPPRAPPAPPPAAPA